MISAKKTCEKESKLRKVSDVANLRDRCQMLISHWHEVRLLIMDCKSSNLVLSIMPKRTYREISGPVTPTPQKKSRRNHSYHNSQKHAIVKYYEENKAQGGVKITIGDVIGLFRYVFMWKRDPQESTVREWIAKGSDFWETE